MDRLVQNSSSAYHSHPEASILTTVRTWFNSLPLCTKAIFSLIVTVYIFELLTGYDDAIPVCLSPKQIAVNFQAYRILTAVIVHGGLLHVAFNMLAFVPMGCSLERLIGTVQFAYLILVIAVLEALIYITVAYILYMTHIYPPIMFQCAIGFSGIIFGLIVIDNSLSSAATRSIFGLFTVPAILYPWALLLFWQLLLPSASFLGHLSGVLVGQFWVWGYLRPLQLTRTATAWLESTHLVSTRLVPMPSFIMLPGPVLPYSVETPAHSIGLLTRLYNRWRQPDTGNAPQHRHSQDPHAEASASGSGQPSDSIGSKAFQGQGRAVGGGAGAVVSAAPRTAAALAAEARVAKSPGTSSGDRAHKGGGQAGEHDANV